MLGDAVGSLVADLHRSHGVDLRLGEPEILDECWLEEDTSDVVPPRDGAGPVWPFGLAVNVLLGAAGFVVAVRRLRTPQRTLPRGTRVA